MQPPPHANNDDLHRVFGCKKIGGIRYSVRKRCIVLIMDARSNEANRPYPDERDGDRIGYVGEGRVGDQTLTRNNRRIDRPGEGIRIFVYERIEPLEGRNRYAFVGEVVREGDAEERWMVEGGRRRRIYVFPLRILTTT